MTTLEQAYKAARVLIENWDYLDKYDQAEIRDKLLPRLERAKVAIQADDKGDKECSGGSSSPQSSSGTPTTSSDQSGERSSKDKQPPKDTSFWGMLSDHGRQKEYERVLKENFGLKGAVRDLKDELAASTPVTEISPPGETTQTVTSSDWEAAVREALAEFGIRMCHDEDGWFWVKEETTRPVQKDAHGDPFCRDCTYSTNGVLDTACPKHSGYTPLGFGRRRQG